MPIDQFRQINAEFVYKLYDQIYQQNLNDLNLSNLNEFDEIRSIHYLLNKYSTERSLNYNHAVEEYLPKNFDMKSTEISEDIQVVRQLQTLHTAVESSFNQQWMLFLILEFFDGINRDRSKEEFVQMKKTPEVLNAFGILSGIKISQSQQMIFSEGEIQAIRNLQPNKFSPISIVIPDFPYFIDDPELKEKFKGYFNTLNSSGFRPVFNIKLDKKSKESYLNSLLFKNTDFDNIFSKNPKQYDDFSKLNVFYSIPQEFVDILIQFYRNEVLPLLPDNKKKEFSNLINVFSFLLNNFYGEPFKIVKYQDFKKLFNSNDLGWGLITEFVLESNSHRTGFRKFYKLLEKPLLRYNPENLIHPTEQNYNYTKRTSSSDDNFIISWILLFDSFLFNIARIIKSKEIRRKRGAEFELLISQAIKENLEREPFKLILYNSKKSNTDRKYLKLRSRLKKYYSGFDCYEVDVTGEVTEKEKFTYHEYDVCFIYDNILFLLECKNKLYFKLTEIDQILLKEFINIDYKTEIKENLLIRPEIKQQVIEQTGISYEKVKSRIITPIKISLKRATTLEDFTNYLQKIRDVL